MKDDSAENNCRDTERGAVILIVGLLLFAIFALLALAIDLVVLASAREQTINAARFAGLSALKTYWAASQDLPISTRLDQALAAANRASSLNLVLSGSGTLSPDPMSLTTSANMKLIAGKWYVQNPSLCNNPCTSGRSVPCFVPLNNVNPACEPGSTPQPNAFQVIGRSVSRLQLIFSRVFSSGEKDLDVREIATLTPRVLIFLVDLSDSMFLQTHSAGDPQTPSLYSYFLASDNGTTSGRFDSLWAAVPPTRPGSGTDPYYGTGQYPKAHYRSDFEIKTAYSDADYGSDPNRQKRHPDPTTFTNYSAAPLAGTYRIDTFRNPGAGYYGGEPFRSVFEGLRVSIKAFKNRAVVGDRVGLVFYDDTITWPRIFLPTDDYEYLLRFTEFDRIGEAGHGVDLLISHGIFPSKSNKSNTMLAVTEGTRLINLAQSAGVPSSPALIHIGDQLWNCIGACPPNTIGCRPNRCSDNGYYYKWASSALDTYVTNEFMPKRIPLHIMHFGAHAGAHQLNVLNRTTNRCMTDTEARQRTTVLTRPETYANDAALNSDYVTLSDSNPFYLAAYNAHMLAIKTTGFYLPIRPQDSSSCNLTCTDTNTETAPRGATQCNSLTESVTDASDRIMQGTTFSIVTEVLPP